MIWVESETHLGWTCSDCGWGFKPLGPPLGNSIEEMQENYGRQARQEFAAHDCARHTGAKGKGPGERS